MNLSNSVNEIDNSNKKASFSLMVSDDYDLFTDYYWIMADGRYIEDQQVIPIDWVGPGTPRAIFRRLDLPEGSILYQERLRNTMFTIMYIKEGKDVIYQIENSFSNNKYDFEFRNNFSTLITLSGGYFFGNQNRVGEQPNKDYPLVGIWGELPHLTEYRIVNPTDCMYYLEIYREIPYFAVREGTYLLKQIDDSTFETVTSFPDGHLRLEIIDERTIILRPLFTLPDEEEGLLGILLLHRNPLRISEIDDIEF